jgi:predicted nuclease of predicted toxin-antitoxin system
MKVLLDACVWGGARGELAATGHDVVWAGDRSENPGDEEILIRAHSEGRILVTLDKDFGEVAIVRGIAHSGIIRLVNLGARQQGKVCGQVLAKYGKELLSGAMITAEPGRVRIRPPDARFRS